MNEEISLNTILGNNDQNEELIVDLVGGESAKQSTEETSTVQNKPVRRVLTAEDITNNMGAVEEEKPVMNQSAMHMAFADLNKGIDRKISEHKAIMDRLIERSRENEILVESGLATVDGEIKYIPEEAQTEEDKEFSKQVEEESKQKASSNYMDIELDSPIGDAVEDDEVTVKIKNNIEFDDDSDKVAKEIDSKPTNNTEAVKEESSPEDKLKEFMDSGKATLSSSVEDIDTKNIEDKSAYSLDPEDFEELEDETDMSVGDEEDEEKVRALTKAGYNNLRNEILNKLINTAKRMDASAFKISKKSVSVDKIIKKMEDRPILQHSARSAMMNAGKPYMATALTGPEIMLLNSYRAEGEKNANYLNEGILNILHKHDANPYKSASVRTWAKTLLISDLREIYGAIYAASFVDSNYMPYSCDNKRCGHMWLSDHIEVKSMIKFKDDKTEARYNEIANVKFTPDLMNVDTVMIPVNDYVAISFKAPTLYDVGVSMRSLDEEFSSKYITIISVMLYIDKIYMLQEDGLAPVDWKRFTDPGKDFKSKIATYSKVFDNFTSQEFSVVTSYIRSIKPEDEKNIQYLMPEIDCPKCGTHIDGKGGGMDLEVDPRTAVFTHSQLVGMASTSID